MGVLSSLVSAMIPKYVSDSLAKTKTSYPGAASSPWLPGSNAVPKPAQQTQTSRVVIGRVGSNAAPAPAPAATAADPYAELLKSLNFSVPEEEGISYDEAMSRAKTRIEPLRQEALLMLDKTTSDNKERLAQLMAGTGYGNPRGGKRQVGEYNITQNQAINNAKINSDYDANIAETAWGILNNDQSNAINRRNAMIAQQAANNAAQIGLFEAKNSAALKKEETESNKYNRALDFWIKLLSGITD